MLMLAKTALSLMLGFVIAVIAGLIIVPLAKKFHLGQHVSLTLGNRHLAKEGTPTFGGFIFIIPTLVALLLLYLNGSIQVSSNLIIVIFVFLSYALLGFIDDLLKVKLHNNKGLSMLFKLCAQTVIALVFFYIFIKNGGEPTIEISSLNFEWNMGWGYGLFILFLLVGTSNAVNISDGLDGLCGGLSVISFIAYGLIAWSTSWLTGNTEIAIFSFVLTGSILGFLVFNAHPAKIFMGDTGSLALGGALASIAILTRHELSLAIIGGVFVIEALSSLLQIFWIKVFHKRLFSMAPLHHAFEKRGWAEQDIVKLYWIVGLIFAMIMITYGIWL